MERIMAEDSNNLSRRSDYSHTSLSTLKKHRAALGKRKRDLEGARDYLGERAEPELFSELDFVNQQLQEIKEAIQKAQAARDDEVASVVRLVEMTQGVSRLYIDLPTVQEEYVPFEQAGLLELHYGGDTPSLLNFCAFNVALDNIVNQVASALVADAIQSERLPPQIRNQIIHSSMPPRYVSTRIVSLRIGSFDEVLSFAILPLLAHPDVRPILQNLVSSAIWVLGERVGKTVRGRVAEPPSSIVQINVSPYIEGALAAVAGRPGEPIDIHIVHQLSNQEKLDISICINGDKRSLSDTPPKNKQLVTKKREPRRGRTRR